MYTIKPIETKYDGYRMRSRTEARYAVMFRACSLAVASSLSNNRKDRTRSSTY